MDADTLNEDVEVINGRLVWNKGIWRCGIWEDGVWCGGIWEGGIWKDGKWCGGYWHDGIWEDGVWHKGKMWSNTRQEFVKVKQVNGRFEEFEDIRNLAELRALCKGVVNDG